MRMLALDFFIKVLAWTMFVAPMITFVVLSAYMVMGAAKDDDVIMGLVVAGGSIFGVGAVVLFLTYMTDFSLSKFLGA